MFSQNRKYLKGSSHLFVFLVLLVIVGVVIGFTKTGGFGIKNNQSNQIPQPVSLFFDPTQTDLMKSSEVKLMLDAKAQKVAFARVVVSFDKSKVKLVQDIQTTPSLSTVAEKTAISKANSSGKVVVMLGLSPEQSENPPSGTFELATLKFEKLSKSLTGEVDLSIDVSESQIVDLNENALEINPSNGSFLLGS